MIDLLGTSLAVFIGVTVCLIGFAAYMTGQALANNWRPIVQVFLYCALLGLVDRFLVFALFEGELLSISGYIIDTAVLMGISVLSYRMTQAHKMVTQYPWIYESSGPLGWREKR